MIIRVWDEPMAGAWSKCSPRANADRLHLRPILRERLVVGKSPRLPGWFGHIVSTPILRHMGIFYLSGCFIAASPKICTQHDTSKPTRRENANTLTEKIRLLSSSLALTDAL